MRPPRKSPRGSITATLLAGLALVAVGIPVLFWFRFGDVGPAWGLAGFLILVIVTVRFASRMPPSAEGAAYRRGPFDVLGVVWLLSIPFGPLFGWLSTEQLTADNWQTVAGIRAFVCVAAPAIGVLPLLRFVRGPRAPVAAVILLVGTAFPVVIGWGAARDVLQGPVWEEVDVKSVRTKEYTVGGGYWVRTPAIVDLADGRTLRTAAGVAVHRGAMGLLVLQGLARVIDSEH